MKFSKIKYPNPYGKAQPSKETVFDLQKQYHFSEQYADFLLTQNGIDFDNDLSNKYLNSIEVDEDYVHPCFDLRYLYGVSSDSEFTDLLGRNEDNYFLPYFFMIGRGYDGSAYAEVCFGEKKGTIIFLDAEVYMGSENIDVLLDNLDVDEDQRSHLAPQEIADLLLDPDLGLTTIMSDSISSFLNEMLGYSEYGRGVIHFSE